MAKKLVYVQNGNAYQSVEVTLAQMSGDMVEVKSGLFEFDCHPALRLFMLNLYGSTSVGEHHENKAKAPSPASDSANNKEQLPWWLALPVGERSPASWGRYSLG